ncbi:MAG: hypothetical protein ACTIOG_12730 [Pseudomonas helleri]|uniref:hypothetical protein n=1 Tax=Pseudomonas helleri TaxID=1608996 RepID=UPI003FD5E306
MTETSEQRSKRQYLENHRSGQWQYKHTIFYPDQDSTGLLEEMVGFKQLLRRKCPAQPFLVRIQLNKTQPHPLQAFLVIYTSKEVEDLQSIVDKTFKRDMNVMGRALSAWKLEKSAQTIVKQKPHNLDKYFGKTGVKRWSVLNKGLIDKSLRYKDFVHPDD